MREAVIRRGMKRAVPLTAKQQRFVAEYGRYLNASKAARTVGYSQKNSDVASAKLMRKSHVRAAVERLLDRERRGRRTARQREESMRDFEIMQRLRRRLRR